MDQEQLGALLEIVEGWQKQVDEWADNRLSTKYKYMQDELYWVVKFLRECSE